MFSIAIWVIYRQRLLVFWDCFRPPSPSGYVSPLGHFSYEFLAHRNRSDFCDLRLRCPSRTPEIARFLREEKAMLHCDLRVRWKVASDLRFRAAISEPKTPSLCGISGDLAQSTRKSLAIAIVRFWCAKYEFLGDSQQLPQMTPSETIFEGSPNMASKGPSARFCSSVRFASPPL